MTEAVLLLVICALAALLAYDRHESRRERTKLIQAVMSKNAQDLKDFELAEKVTITQNIEPQLPDMTAIEELSDEDFTKFILGDKEPANA